MVFMLVLSAKPPVRDHQESKLRGDLKRDSEDRDRRRRKNINPHPQEQFQNAKNANRENRSVNDIECIAQF